MCRDLDASRDRVTETVYLKKPAFIPFPQGKRVATGMEAGPDNGIKILHTRVAAHENATLRRTVRCGPIRLCYSLIRLFLFLNRIHAARLEPAIGNHVGDIVGLLVGFEGLEDLLRVGRDGADTYAGCVVDGIEDRDMW